MSTQFNGSTAFSSLTYVSISLYSPNFWAYLLFALPIYARSTATFSNVKRYHASKSTVNSFPQFIQEQLTANPTLGQLLIGFLMNLWVPFFFLNASECYFSQQRNLRTVKRQDLGAGHLIHRLVASRGVHHWENTLCASSRR